MTGRLVESLDHARHAVRYVLRSHIEMRPVRHDSRGLMMRLSLMTVLPVSQDLSFLVTRSYRGRSTVSRGPPCDLIWVPGCRCPARLRRQTSNRVIATRRDCNCGSFADVRQDEFRRPVEV
nr:hypothetical protein CFP56_50963 [Quercus suber]